MAKSQMPGYLLRAPAADMNRWKGAAASSGQPLAEYARQALDNMATTSTGDFHLATTGKYVPPDMVVLSRACYRNDHHGCQVSDFATQPCECNCHTAGV